MSIFDCVCVCPLVVKQCLCLTEKNPLACEVMSVFYSEKTRWVTLELCLRKIRWGSDVCV